MTFGNTGRFTLVLSSDTVPIESRSINASEFHMLLSDTIVLRTNQSFECSLSRLSMEFHPRNIIPTDHYLQLSRDGGQSDWNRISLSNVTVSYYELNVSSLLTKIQESIPAIYQDSIKFTLDNTETGDPRVQVNITAENLAIRFSPMLAPMLGYDSAMIVKKSDAKSLRGRYEPNLLIAYSHIYIVTPDLVVSSNIGNVSLPLLASVSIGKDPFLSRYGQFDLDLRSKLSFASVSSNNLSHIVFQFYDRHYRRISFDSPEFMFISAELLFQIVSEF